MFLARLRERFVPARVTELTEPHRDKVREGSKRSNIEADRPVTDESQNEPSPGENDIEQDSQPNGCQRTTRVALGSSGWSNQQGEDEQHSHNLYRLRDGDSKQQKKDDGEQTYRDAARLGNFRVNGGKKQWTIEQCQNEQGDNAANQDDQHIVAGHTKNGAKKHIDRFCRVLGIEAQE